MLAFKTECARLVVLTTLLLCSSLAAVTISSHAKAAGKPDGVGSYDDLVVLFEDFLAWRDPSSADGIVDYSTDAVARRQVEMQRLQQRLSDMGVARWDRSQEVDYLAVRAQFDEQDFLLNVAKPWSRDPGFYVDKMLHLAFTELPVKGQDREIFQARLRAIPRLVSQAKDNLTEVAAEFADLAIFNLTISDGVGHGHPYREVPPAGVIGWYEDLLGRAGQQTALRTEIGAALAAVREFHEWLVSNRAQMAAPAGVGKAAFDWFLKHAMLLPYTSDQVIAVSRRELERTWAAYALERHRNRDLPELELADSREDYLSRIADTDELIRDWLVEEEFISIPDFIPTDWREMGSNVPWIERPEGPNFWEQVQYRDPSPDHLHAVIPGHRFDERYALQSTHPIRRHIRDGVRHQGWGVYLEEAPLQLGLFDDLPRTRELIYIFGIFRAARTVGDVFMQRNEWSVDETIDYWMEWTPYLDQNVARGDAELYLRRNRGNGRAYTIGALYVGLSYTIGHLQIKQLLADVKQQLGDPFVLKDFHDEFLLLSESPVTVLSNGMLTAWPHQERMNSGIPKLIR